MAYATIEDIRAAHPAQLVLLGADEDTGALDEARVARAIEAAAADMNGILFRRYTSAQLARLDDPSRAILRTYGIDIALYRVAVSAARSSERLKEGYDAAITRLTAIAEGKGGLSFEGAAGGADGGELPTGPASPNEAIVIAPERILTRDRLRGW